MEWDDEGDTEDLYMALMDLLDGGRRKEVVWKASAPFATVADIADLDEVRAEYGQLFEEAVGEVTLAYGQPRFLGDRSRSDFPPWSEAVRLAVWAGEEDEMACYVAVSQGRREDPVELRIGVR